MRKVYPSDINRTQFEKIRPQLESVRKSTKPRDYDLYDVFCGVLFVLKGGVPWRMLPGDFPKWRSVHEYFRMWSEVPPGGGQSVLSKCLAELVIQVRERDGRAPQTSLLIVDAQSVKNTDTATEKGYDAGKRVSGIKRHLAVDTQGLPHALHVTTASVNDRSAALEMFQLRAEPLSAVALVLGDGGYVFREFCGCRL
jgi:transposase